MKKSEQLPRSELSRLSGATHAVKKRRHKTGEMSQSWSRANLDEKIRKIKNSKLPEPDVFSPLFSVHFYQLMIAGILWRAALQSG